MCNQDAGANNGPTETDWEDIPRATSASYTPGNFVAGGANGHHCGQLSACGRRPTRTASTTKTDPNTEPDTAMEETDAVVQAARATNSAPKFPDQDLTTPGDQSDETSRTVAENTGAGHEHRVGGHGR